MADPAAQLQRSTALDEAQLAFDALAAVVHDTPAEQ
jgi:hypothetical protein